MRRYWVNYWLTAFYNGVVVGIWPAAAIAFITAGVLRTLSIFPMVFLGCMAFWVPVIMWMYHTEIWPMRRQRQRQPQQQRQRQPQRRRLRLLK